ncbi:MAG: mycothione reductase [Acidimicrobiales bacterium]|nr:mycothione reductase [Acidimicrobiales bacterium]MDP6299027.1 mycothione reductase [Acidimicrobiales bacterium]HJM28765.1 mycothione reductase [Acidimicrobiales bacterium]
MQKYDLIIIGTGSGNTIITPEFDDLEIAIIEKDVFGGTCLNRGCIPSKMLIHVADVITEITHSHELGITIGSPTVNWPEIQSRIFGRIDPISNSGEDYRKNLPNVTVYSGEASFVTSHEIMVGDEVIRGDQIVIATGATPVLPTINGLADVPFHTSDSIMRIDELPGRLAIIGGGYIATELAHVFSAFGSDVVMLVRGNTLLPQEDISIQERFVKVFSERVDVRFNTTINQIKQKDNVIVCEYGDNGPSLLEVDMLLIATGRLPNLDSLNVGTAGINTKNGYIVTDEYMRTSVENIWALGDVTNPHQLKHTANAEAKIVSHNLIHSDLRQVDLKPIPHAVFTNPQISSVGYTQQTLDDMNASYVTATEEYSDVAYGWAMENTTGFCKIIADPTSGMILGAHIIGPQSSTMIHQLIQGMKFNQTVKELSKGFLYVHPALSEVVENALIKASDECEQRQSGF